MAACGRSGLLTLLGGGSILCGYFYGKTRNTKLINNRLAELEEEEKAKKTKENQEIQLKLEALKKSEEYIKQLEAQLAKYKEFKGQRTHH